MIDVSIVLITYNDAARLPRALASLQRQTLRNLEIIVVDDASTDATQGLVLEAAASDSRIRYVRLAENSGGCSAPRNRGMSEAVGTWLMFCDSDDEFDRHAAKNLLRAVEAADADLGCGVAERIDVRTRKVKRWKEELHERGVLASISERPDLIADTVSVNKIYRHEWLVDSGITFPEGILYEDQLFTMKAYAEARRIAVISETVYLWYVDKAGSELSITQRRNEIRNARSRVEVNRLIDEYLQAHGDPDLARVNAQKFLAHDLYLYLAAMLEMDDADATAIADVLRPYVESVDLAQAAAQRPALRVATYHLLVGDLAGLRRAMRFIRWSAVVDAPVVVRPTGVFWGCAYLDGGPSFQGLGPEWWLDVTSLHLDRFQVSQRRWCHRLDVLAAGGRRLSVAGRTTDAFGDFGRASAVEFVLVLGGQVVASMPLALERGTADDSSKVAPEWAWHSTGQRLAAVGDEFEDLSRGHFALRVTIDGVSNVIAVRATERAVPRVILPGVDPALGLRAYPGDHGVVRWQAGRHTRSERARARLRRWTSRVSVPAGRAWRALARRFGEALPAGKVAVFGAPAGQPLSGQARAIGVALHRLHPGIHQAWVSREGDRPPWARMVRPGSARYAWSLARARWWVEDGGMPTSARRPQRVKAVRTVEEFPVARTGRDDPDWDLTAPSARRSPERPGRRWDASRCVDRADARRVLDLPTDRVVAVYAPLGDSCLIDLDTFVDALGDRVFLVIVSGSGASVDVPAVLRHSVRDIPGPDDRELAYASSDLLITDFSAVMRDFVMIGRPIVLYAPSFDTFVSRTKGTSIDLVLEGPGPITRTTAELVDAVDALIDNGLAPAELYQARALRFGQLAGPVPSPDEVAASLIEGH